MSKSTPQHLPEEREVDSGKHGVEELVHTPKGRNPLAFLLLVVLTIILTVTFSMTPSTFACFSRAQGKDVAMKWQRPGRGEETISMPEFIELKRRMAGFGRDVKNEEVAAMIVGNRLAEDAGVVISDEELAEFIGTQVGTSSTADYKRAMASFEGGVRGYEEITRMALRQQRYAELLSHLAGSADPAKIEELWKKEHKELAFDYVELEKAGFAEEAKQGMPDDAGLETWFNALPEGEKSQYKSQAKVEAELAGYVFPSQAESQPAGAESQAAGAESQSSGSAATAMLAAAQALLAKYPAPEGTDAEKAARDYYNQIFYMRYRRKEPLSADAAKGNSQEEFQRRFYMSFDEVAEPVRAEAPIYNAVVAWRNDMQKRLDAGESVDLSAEAAALGLKHRAGDGLKGQQEWSELSDWDGNFVAYRLMSGSAGKLVGEVITGEKAICVARVLQKQEAALPAFADIRAQIADKWAEKQTGDLMTRKLEELRDKLKPAPPALDTGSVTASEQAFAEAAKSLGLEVKHRDWFDPSAAPAGDPTASSPLGLQLRQQQRIYAELAPDTVPAPATNFATTHAWLLRLAGKREAELSKMTAEQYAGYERQVAGQQQNGVRQALFAADSLKKNYALSLWSESEGEDVE